MIQKIIPKGQNDFIFLFSHLMQANKAGNESEATTTLIKQEK